MRHDQVAKHGRKTGKSKPLPLRMMQLAARWLFGTRSDRNDGAKPLENVRTEPVLMCVFYGAGNRN